MIFPFTKAFREQKVRKSVLSAAKVFILAHEDLSFYATGNASFDALKKAFEVQDAEACNDLLTALDPPKSFAIAREWLDVLVVSISVAMCFRAYLYEPFNIPTGSMQPTLYGNYTLSATPSEKSVWDLPVLSWGKFMITGETFKEFRAPWSGTLVGTPREDGCFDLRVASPLHEPGFWSRGLARWIGCVFAENEVDAATGIARIPNDAIRGNGGDAPEVQRRYSLSSGFALGDRVNKGDLLWCGLVRKGDFLFVNRWLWNFRHPQRGDVMIFSTTGIPGLQQGTHYIKRMTGVPGETLSISNDTLFVNGEKPMAPERIAQIQTRTKFHPQALPYPGYRPSGDVRFNVPGRTLSRAGDVVCLGADEYYACGDNSPSSYDSRYWGPVPARNLCGIAGGVFWPLANHRWGKVR